MVYSKYYQLDQFANCYTQMNMTNSIADNTASKSPSGTKRMSISLSGDTAELLESQGISQNEAIRRAIATDVYFTKERQEGSKVLLQKPDKEIREVVFR
jgi:hypothetical protein